MIISHDALAVIKFYRHCERAKVEKPKSLTRKSIFIILSSTPAESRLKNWLSLSLPASLLLPLLVITKSRLGRQAIIARPQFSYSCQGQNNRWAIPTLTMHKSLSVIMHCSALGQLSSLAGNPCLLPCSVLVFIFFFWLIAWLHLALNCPRLLSLPSLPSLPL